MSDELLREVRDVLLRLLDEAKIIAEETHRLRVQRDNQPPPVCTGSGHPLVNARELLSCCCICGMPKIAVTDGVRWVAPPHPWKPKEPTP